MIVSNTKGKQVRLTLESIEETTELTYQSEFDISKQISIKIQPVITGNDIPILLITIPDDTQILIKEDNDRYFMIAPDLNTEGWSKISK